MPLLDFKTLKTRAAPPAEAIALSPLPPLPDGPSTSPAGNMHSEPLHSEPPINAPSTLPASTPSSKPTNADSIPITSPSWPLPTVNATSSPPTHPSSNRSTTLSADSWEKPRPAPPPPRHPHHSIPPFPPPPARKDQYLVTFTHSDPHNPQQWPTSKKLLTAMVATFSCFCSTFASSAFSPNIIPLSRHFHVSTEVTTLTTSLFIFGYALGPMVWGPLSEVQGRRTPIIVAMGGFVCFSAGVSTGKDLQTVLICRFFEGVMGSCPLSVVAGLLGDLYDQLHRGVAIACFATTLFVGPIAAPFIGGFTVMNESLGWRFNGYWVLILSGLSLVLCVLFLEETYAPVLLQAKAAKMRKETGNWALYAQQDGLEVDVKEMVTKYFTRPVKMLVQEPVLFLVSFYMSFIYGILYLTFTAYPLVFQGVHGFNPGLGGLPFFSLAVGVFGSCAFTVFSQKSYQRKLIANDMRPIPEWRLPQAIVGGICLAAGLFWFGWTGENKDIHWIVPTISGLLTGFGIISIFMPLFNYLIDTYLMLAASAISANTIMRSAFAGGFPMFASYMYKGLGIGKATTVLGAVATALIPVPILFYFFGARLRAGSKFAPTLNIAPTKSKVDEEKGTAGLERWSAASKLSNRLSLTNQRRSVVRLSDVPQDETLDVLIRQRYQEILLE